MPKNENCKKNTTRWNKGHNEISLESKPEAWSAFFKAQRCIKEAKNGTSSAGTKNLSFQFFWKKIRVIGKRGTFLFDFELLTAWNNLERDRIPAGLARDWGLKGVKLANSELRTPSIWKKVWTNKQNYCNIIDILVQLDCVRNCNVNQDNFGNSESVS